MYSLREAFDNFKEKKQHTLLNISFVMGKGHNIECLII